MIVVGDIHAKRKEPFLSSILSLFDWLYEGYSNQTIILLGDLFDTSSPHNLVEKYVLEKLVMFKEVYIITGNHDFSKRQGNTLLPFGVHDKIKVITEPTHKIINGLSCLFLPYSYGDVMKGYEELKGRHDYIFTHVTPKQCAFGDEGLNLQLTGTYVHGHTHMQEDFIDDYGNTHHVLGVSIPTRHLEHKQDCRMMNIEDSQTYKFIPTPFYFTYETINYGEEPQFPNSILNIKKAPSLSAVYEKYGKYFIREQGTEIVFDEVQSEVAFEVNSLTDSFTKFATNYNMDEGLTKTCLKYLSEVSV